MVMRVAVVLSHLLRQAVITHSGMFIFSILRGEKFTFVISTTRCILSSFIWNVEKCPLFLRAFTPGLFLRLDSYAIRENMN